MAKRLEVLKTYKMYSGGKFIRSESGRYFISVDKKGTQLANVCRASRKDVRDAVGTAREAFGGWAARSPFNRGQILYRIAEVLEGRKEQFRHELTRYGIPHHRAEKEVTTAIDRLLYYAGWSDKYTQVFSSVNPVASSHFNFSIPEPTGLVAAIAPDDSPLLGLVSVIAPVIVGGNTMVVLASETYPLPAASFAEVLNTSDIPGGVVNLLTGYRSELIDHLGRHMDVNAIHYTDGETEAETLLQQHAALNIKRVVLDHPKDWASEKLEHPYTIMDFQEIKTTWHPVGY